jgi:toluene monooxygenase system ferredoxin subunit
MTPLASLRSPEPEYHRVCQLEDLWEGEMAEFEVAGTRVLLVHAGGGHLTAIQPLCPHQRVRLVEGELAGTVLTCRAHLWQIDVRSGHGLNPQHARVAIYPVKVEDGQVLVSVAGVGPRYSAP